MRLFISYARVDKAIVRDWVVKTLTAGGYDVWFDDRLTAGRNWQDQLKNEIEKSDALVFCMTPESVKSEWCLWELQQAAQLGKAVIPVLMQERTVIPEYLQTFHYVDFSQGATGDAVARLMGGLQNVSPSQIPPAPRNPQGNPPQALEQEKKIEQNIILKILRDPAFQAIFGVIGVLIAIIALVVSGSGVGTPLASQPTPSTARITALRNMDIRDGPDTVSNRIAVLNVGDYLDILGISQDNRWYQVLLPDGNLGWVVAASSAGEVSRPIGALAVIVLTETPTFTPTITSISSNTPPPTLTFDASSVTTVTQTTPQNVSISTNTPRTYPCTARIRSEVTVVTQLQQLYSQPRTSSLRLNTLIRVGDLVSIEEERNAEWYRITETDGTLLGWIQAQYLDLSHDCP